jgi:hypothetical protein
MFDDPRHPVFSMWPGVFPPEARLHVHQWHSHFWMHLTSGLGAELGGKKIDAGGVEPTGFAMGESLLGIRMFLVYHGTVEIQGLYLYVFDCICLFLDSTK